MPLAADSVDWALSHLSSLGDSDLFPKPAELEAFAALRDDFKALLTSQELGGFEPSAARRFMVPKDDWSFRRATQLNPCDAIILTAVMHQYGAGIERRRRSTSERRVFSFRFAPQPNFWLYDRSYDWTPFWIECRKRSHAVPYAVILDISDFYNQVYHHTVENQLIECGFPNTVIKWILGLLKHLTAEVSRGLPVGPHAAHLLAEASLIPIDNSMVSHGIDYVRYVDDIIVFATSDMDARKRLYEIADILDKQQRLILNREKTKIVTADALRSRCDEMIEDRPINDLEDAVLKVIKKYSGGNPYQTVLLSQLSAEDTLRFAPATLERILNEYLSQSSVDFVRLRWFLRRLTQVGHPGAVECCLANLDRLTPALADVCHYLLAASNNRTNDAANIGARLIAALDNELIATSEYFQLCLLALFSRNEALNHFSSLANRYEASSGNIKREIILAARHGTNGDWLRELKESFASMDEWCRNAFLVAAKALPAEERRFFANSVQLKNDVYDKLLLKWLKAN